MTRPSPTLRLLAGLAVILLAVAVYSGYTIRQLRTLRTLQEETIDRNRTDSLLLLRIQNGLNSVALALRDMVDERAVREAGSYPLTAWQPQFRRLRADLDDALLREEKYSTAAAGSQRRYLTDSFRQFHEAIERMFALAADGHETEAREQIRLSLEARQEALSASVARLLVQNNASEEAAAQRTHEIYDGVERNVYVFFTAVLLVIVTASVYLVSWNRRLFEQVAQLSERRSELARQLITMQESAFRSISRELHDDFGQILTAIGALLQRADRKPGDLLEVREIVQSTLEKVRSLSHALHPMVLDEVGLESAFDVYLPGFERQTGIAVRYEKSGTSQELDREISIHLYRVAQEALNNAARHSGSKAVAVRLRFLDHAVVLEIEDNGIGFTKEQKRGLGLVSMRERAELMNGRIEFLEVPAGGALVRVTTPLTSSPAEKEAHV